MSWHHIISTASMKLWHHIMLPVIIKVWHPLPSTVPMKLWHTTLSPVESCDTQCDNVLLSPALDGGDQAPYSPCNWRLSPCWGPWAPSIHPMFSLCRSSLTLGRHPAPRTAVHPETQLSVRGIVLRVRDIVLSVRGIVLSVKDNVLSVRGIVLGVRGIVLGVRDTVLSVRGIVLNVRGIVLSVRGAVLSVRGIVTSRVSMRWFKLDGVSTYL